MEFTELFKIQYNGYPEQLQELIEELRGVNSVSIDIRFENVKVDTQLDCTIKYDAYETDRTWIRQRLEAHQNVSEAIMG